MEGILALMIPVLALSIGLVHSLRRPPREHGDGRELDVPPQVELLAQEVAQLREELAQTRERVDFTERLLMGPAPGAQVPQPARAAATPQA